MWLPLAPLLAIGITGCAADPDPDASAPTPFEAITIASPRATPRPPYRFSPEDQAFLDEVQRGCFNYLWNCVAPDTGMVYDRTSVPIVSIAGVGFQLSAIPVAVERAWITRQAGQDRARLILESLLNNPANRKAGLYFHYLDGRTAGPTHDGYELVVSTIDSALLFSGVMTASSYFGGRVRDLGDQIMAEADWSFFVLRETTKPYEANFVSLGWRPTEPDDPTGDGELLPYVWADAGDEQRLVSFLAVGTPTPGHEVDPAMYYRLRRYIGRYLPEDRGDEGLVAWFPWSGALFTSFFAHCWIDYASLGPDDPAVHGVRNRPRIDWWENSRRVVKMHQLDAEANPLGLPTLGRDAWGLSASDSPRGYAVPGLFPDSLDMAALGATPEFDFSTFKAKDDWGDGTIAPYAAGSAIMFDPERALAALEQYRTLAAPDGSPLVWRDPATGGFGFQDAFNLGVPWVAPDCVAIDQGPLLLAIENARSGHVWEWFGSHMVARTARERLGFSRANP